MKTKVLLGTLAGIGLLAAHAGAQVTVTTVITNGFGLQEPYNVAVDANNNYYVSDSVNNRIVKVDDSSGSVSTFSGLPDQAAGNDDGPSYQATFNDPQGLVMTPNGLVVTDTGSHLIRLVNLADGSVTTLAGMANNPGSNDGVGSNASFSSPTGMATDGNDTVYIADTGNNLIRRLTLSTKNVTTVNANTTFYQPNAVALQTTNQLWVADTRNNAVKLINLTDGSVITTIGSTNGVHGTADSTRGVNAQFYGPRGLLWVDGTGLLIADTGNQTIRMATLYTNFGPNNYAVSTFAGIPGQQGYVDAAALSAKFNNPIGLALNFSGNILVADLANNILRIIQNGPPLPAVPDPEIGWVKLVYNPTIGTWVSQLQTAQPFVFNNDVIIAIEGTDGTQTFFTNGPTPSLLGGNPIPDPTRACSTPPPYQDNLLPSQLPPSLVSPQPDMTIKAIGMQVGRPNSSVVSARFQFITANPTILGNNAASFIVTNQTIGAEMWYTIDGTDPTNAAPSLGPITSPATLSVSADSNITFKVFAVHDNYANSSIISTTFSPTNYMPNRITFGFASGEASSDFVASPGQFFYAPVTLSILTGTEMYSLQFNITVTNLGSTPPVLRVQWVFNPC